MLIIDFHYCGLCFHVHFSSNLMLMNLELDLGNRQGSEQGEEAQF